ncbi:hypothetical protein [Oenococcus sp.]|uniref:hypothetical protein n=1 Tax=Oenococcus sp. TaxID=1979414 RepID=UPI0039E7BD54
MEAEIEIAGKKVHIKSSGVSPILYKTAFGQDYFNDIAHIYEVLATVPGPQDFKDKNNPDAVQAALNYQAGLGMAVIKSGIAMTMIDFLWVYAKNYDDKIPQLEEWLKSFDDMPINDFFDELMTFIDHSLQTKKV